MPRGRPKLSKHVKLTAKLVVNVHADTYKRTKAAAAVLSMQLSDYLRHAIEIANRAVLGTEQEVVDPYDRMPTLVTEMSKKVTE